MSIANTAVDPLRRNGSVQRGLYIIYSGLPPDDADDEVSYERNLKLIQDEQEKPRPRAEALKDLMHRTYSGHWDAFVNHTEPASLSEYIQLYSFFKEEHICKLILIASEEQCNTRSPGLVYTLV